MFITVLLGVYIAIQASIGENKNFFQLVITALVIFYLVGLVV